MQVTNKVPTGWFLQTFAPRKTIKSGYNAGRQIYEPYTYLDQELRDVLGPWIRSGRYHADKIVITSAEKEEINLEWADFVIIARIRKIVNEYNLPGRLIIQDLAETINIFWVKE